MSVRISKTEDGFLVNDKPVYLDGNCKWVAEIELTSSEKKEFNNHLLSL